MLTPRQRNPLRPDPAGRRHGFTLIELLVAIGAMAVVLFYTLGTFTANRNAYVVIDQVSEAHQNLLAIASLIERDIRNAGYMVPNGAATCGVDNTNTSDILFVSDADSILPADQLGSSQAGGELSVGVTALPSSWSNPISITVDDIVLDGTATYPTSPAADFRPGGGIIVFHPDFPGLGVGCGILNAHPGGTTSLSYNSVANADTSSTTTGWEAVPAHVYRLNGNALERDGVVLARNVEDLQFAWFIDADDDGQVDAGEYVGIGGGPTLDVQDPPGTAPNGDDFALIREIRLNIVVRTAEDDPNETLAGAGQATENQTAAPGPDGRRRRVYTSTVRLRNVSS